MPYGVVLRERVTGVRYKIVLSLSKCVKILAAMGYQVFARRGKLCPCQICSCKKTLKITVEKEAGLCLYYIRVLLVCGHR